MSEIYIRLDSDVYTAGDTVFGAVYLKVDGPTSGYGIKLSIKGTENYSYHDARRLSVPRSRLSDGCVLQGKSVLLDEQLILCLLQGPFAIGQYVFPFKQTLPRHLPGSFEQRSWHGPKWEAQISYHTTAEVVGAEPVKTLMPFKISPLVEHNTSPVTEINHRVRTNKVIRAFKTDFGLTIRLDKSSYILGDTVKIMTQLHTTETHIKHINIKLMRSLRFILDQTAVASTSECQHCNPNGIETSCEILEVDDNNSVVWPEDGQVEVWNASLSNEKSMQGCLVPTVFMLLSADHQGFALQPSIHSQLIQCHYSLQFDIELAVGDKILADVPIPNIAIQKSDSTQLKWEQKDWMRSCVPVLPDNFHHDQHWTDWSVYTKLNFPTLSFMRSPASRRRLGGKERSVPLPQVLSSQLIPRSHSENLNPDRK